ncbi:Plant self-incompatibility protein S1 family [Forsythia ovata]|uniref:S-protein homolog n=1 Tax=Forsythia ovata TaxID=205694 RepID=A0ABD1X3F5_9LAMI
MSSFNIKLVVLSLNLLFIIPLEARPTAHVNIIGNVDKGTLTIHCYSEDDDLGTHVLAYNQAFPFSFSPNIWGTTKFYCDSSTQFGSGNYAVFDHQMLTIRCGLNCVWYIKDNGPCLVINPTHELWCQPWKKPSELRS